MCAAGGKIILTLVFHTILYHHLKFHEIIFQIDKTTVISASPPILPPKSPPREIYGVNFHTRPGHLSMTVDIYIYIDGHAKVGWTSVKVYTIYFSKGGLRGEYGG